MGVTGLWTVLQPCARPIKIETLNKKRLAVDASIWIYQFLKAVRDKEGNSLRNSHIVGFFRRICKLLFFGIKPVFVFDGGAPALKRQTISNRKSRREGRREDAVRTAGKLLAIQMQRAAEEEEKKRKEAKEASRHIREEPAEEIPEDLVYADEILQTQQERQANRKFKKNDQFHLPDLGMSLEEMGGQNDPRIMSLEELEEYARQFDKGEDINVYDFSKIDFDGAFFQSLPVTDRYNILNAARLRSRLRMGLSKDQLDTMFPDRMAFSRFQIERVAERNDLTQRLMNINGVTDGNSVNRIASERGREYVLVKNDGVEGGWALGVVTNHDEGKINKPIDVDSPETQEEEWEDEDEFEDVPIEGLNRLPKPKPGSTALETQELAKRRQNFYDSRKQSSPQPRTRKAKPVRQDPESLFLSDEDEEEWENVQTGGVDGLFEEPGDNEEETQLQKAIALSLSRDNVQIQEESEQEEDIMKEVFQQERVPDEAAPFASGSGLALARQANQRSIKMSSRGPFIDSDSEDDDMDLQAALRESRNAKRATSPKRPTPKPKPLVQRPPPAQKPVPKSTNAPGFDGPLPFESLNLGSSILGKKKMKQIEDATAGGFERVIEPEKKKSTDPLPPWFEGKRDVLEEMTVQKAEEKAAWEKEKTDEQYQFEQLPQLRKQGTREVIDLDASSTQEKSKEVITVISEDEDDMEMEDVLMESRSPTLYPQDEVQVDTSEPQSEAGPSQPKPKSPMTLNTEEVLSDDEPVEWSESEVEDERPLRTQISSMGDGRRQSRSPSPEFEDVPLEPSHAHIYPPPKSPSPEFEDVPINTEPTSRPRRERSPMELQGPETLDLPFNKPVPEEELPPYLQNDDDSDQYSDPEDADLFASLAAEAEEHARFAQELNNNQTVPISFDEELKQLRAQQKKDRRDADEVTQTMIAECKHLLTLFGLPYVTAPMEAEAQCAELVNLGLVDGIVTDDSDTFLFGGTRVYKNMFNAAKFVECYLANDLATEFSLTRDKLIAIAQLLGSDYCTGLPGIGPVTALEIISEFGDLGTFKEWWTGVQEGRISKEDDKSSPFRRRFRRSQATKLFLPINFPDPRVAEAYMEPEVDSDPQPFQWGVPDLDALRAFLSSQIGWSWERTDEVLVPVIRDMNRREKEGTQANITRFFDGAVGAGAFAPRVRKNNDRGAASGKKTGKSRLGAALTRLAEREKGSTGEADEESGVTGDAEVIEVIEGRAPVEDVQKGKGRKRRAGKKATTATTSDEHDHEVDVSDDDDDLYSEPRKKPRKSGRKK